jgi:zinc transport system ATP-binding protein
VPPAVELEHVTFRYPHSGDPDPILDDVTFQIETDDYLGLIGPNGGGKTTLLKIMLGLLKPLSGSVKVFGKPPAQVRSRIGYVPQHAEIDTAAPATVLDVVLIGRLGRSSWGIQYGSSHRRRAFDALCQTGVEDLSERPISELSGGQRQRVLVARALASEAEILLLDEPMAGVDAPVEQSLNDLLNRLNESLPIVVVSHDIAFVSNHLKSVACLNRRLVCHGASDITAEMIAEAYEDDHALRYVQHTDECPASYREEGDNP